MPAFISFDLNLISDVVIFFPLLVPERIDWKLLCFTWFKLQVVSKFHDNKLSLTSSIHEYSGFLTVPYIRFSTAEITFCTTIFSPVATMSFFVWSNSNVSFISLNIKFLCYSKFVSTQILIVFFLSEKINTYFVLELTFVCQVTSLKAYEAPLFQSSPTRDNVWEIESFIFLVSFITEYTFVIFVWWTKYINKQGFVDTCNRRLRCHVLGLLVFILKVSSIVECWSRNYLPSASSAVTYLFRFFLKVWTGISYLHRFVFLTWIYSLWKIVLTVIYTQSLKITLA